MGKNGRWKLAYSLQQLEVLRLLSAALLWGYSVTLQTSVAASWSSIKNKIKRSTKFSLFSIFLAFSVGFPCWISRQSNYATVKCVTISHFLLQPVILSFFRHSFSFSFLIPTKTFFFRNKKHFRAECASTINNSDFYLFIITNFRELFRRRLT